MFSLHNFQLKFTLCFGTPCWEYFLQSFRFSRHIIELTFRGIKSKFEIPRTYGQWGRLQELLLLRNQMFPPFFLSNFFYPLALYSQNNRLRRFRFSDHACRLLFNKLGPTQHQTRNGRKRGCNWRVGLDKGKTQLLRPAEEPRWDGIHQTLLTA